MIPIAAVLIAAAVLIWHPPSNARRRLRSIAPPKAVDAATTAVHALQWSHLAVAVAASALAILLGGVLGVVAAISAAAVLVVALRRAPAATDDTSGRELALVLELVAASLEAGAPLVVAMEAVSGALPGPATRALDTVVAHVRLGADAGRVAHLLGDPSLGAVAEALVRVGNTGAALAPALRRLATDLRREATSQTLVAVRRLEVLVVVPLGLCFLPAFLLIGVVPVVVGLIPRGIF